MIVKQQRHTVPLTSATQELEKRLKTTFIGAIDDIEAVFKYLRENKEEKVDLDWLFKSLRTSILNRGNKQIRLGTASLGQIADNCEVGKLLKPKN